MGELRTTGAPKVPVSVLSTESTLLELKLKIRSTPANGGTVLGIMKPVWLKALESEVRVRWLRDMLDRDIILRDVLQFGRIIEEKLRVESSKENEIGRQSLLEIMRIKYMDEKRNLRECKQLREALRDFVRREKGRRQYNHVMEKIKQILDKRKRELDDKYKRKTQHLVAIREEEKRGN